MKNLFVIILVSLIGLSNVNAQELIAAHGISFSLAFPKKLRLNISYNLHLRSHVELADDWAFTPLVDAKLSLFRNHMGASLLKKYKAPFYANFTVSYGSLISYYQRQDDETGYVPVFTSIYHNVGNNDYRYNFGFASSQMVQLALSASPDIKRKVLHQQLGNFMLGVDDFYLTYYNDGGPVLTFFGDGEDRYWTGGLVIGYLYRDGQDVHQVEASFDKFTGFTKHAFEATGLLNVDNVVYADIEQFAYNTGRLSLKYINHNLGFGGSFNLWNLPFDLQDYLHRDVSNNPYHHKIEKQYLDIEVYKTYGL